MNTSEEIDSAFVDVPLSVASVSSSVMEEGSDTASDSSENSSSTYRYSHIPWSIYQDKALQLGSQLFPEAKVRDIEILRMRGGSSNRIIGIGIPDSNSQGLCSYIMCLYHKLRALFGFARFLSTANIVQYIVRVPRWSNDLMARNIATLKFAMSKLSIQIPVVVSYDLTGDNALGAPYVLQRRLAGHNLQAVFSQLNLAQRKDLTRKICTIILEIQNSTHSTCAIISGIEPETTQFQMNQLSIPVGADNEGNFRSPPANKPNDTFEFITSTCQRWKDYESTYLEYPNKEWDQFITMATGMYERGFLASEDTFHFTHPDLYPRNILVEITDSESIEVTGILDWDDALFAPRFVACRAPFWLWEGSEEVDEADEYEALKCPQDPDLKEIKDIFEETVGLDFCRYAYGEEYMLLRRMFFILQLGLGYSHHFAEVEAILARWQDLRKEHDADGSII